MERSRGCSNWAWMAYLSRAWENTIALTRNRVGSDAKERTRANNEGPGDVNGAHRLRDGRVYDVGVRR